MTKKAPLDPRILALGGAIDVFDGAPFEDAGPVIDAALKHLRAQGIEVTREELARIGAERFSGAFDFAALLVASDARAAKSPSKRSSPPPSAPRTGKRR